MLLKLSEDKFKKMKVKKQKMEEAMLEMRADMLKTQVEEVNNAKREKYVVVALGLSCMLFLILAIMMN